MIHPLKLMHYAKRGIPITIRQARKIDQPQIIANIEAVCAEEIYLSTDTFILTVDWQQVLADFPRQGLGYLLIVAQVEEEIIGHLRLFPATPGRKSRHVGEIGIVLASAWRNQGVGTALLEFAIAWSRQNGYKKIIASTMQTNQGALRLFAKMGFACEGIRRAEFFVQGNYIDEVNLGLFLEPI
jgi:RimJ/RimL family protein N-acetyltransferase